MSTQRLASFYIDVPALRPGTVGAYAFALMAVAAATAVEFAIDRYVGGARYLTFLLPVIATALISGLGASLFCLAISVAAVHLFLLKPGFSLYAELIALPSLALYVLVSLSSVILITGMRFAIERKDLQEGKARLQFALDAARLGWWRYDVLDGVISGDARSREIFDLTADELSMDDMKKLIHPDDVARFWADHEASLDHPDPRHFAHQYRVLRRDGEVRWVETRRLVHFEGAGREQRATGVVGTVQDITERKQSEEREYLLMREVNHRAKNMLAVVNTIAHQTATTRPQDFIERFSERIKALARNQDLLIRNEWQGVEIADLVRGQLAHLADLIGLRLLADGPRLRVNASAAQAIGLALHELATNAGKYGALSTDTGRVEIRWGIDGETFTMNWTEREGPPVSATQRRGFGTIVMEAMVERSIGGKVDLDYAPSGLVWRLTCRAANALEPLRT